MNGLIVSGGTVDDKLLCEVVKNGAFDVILAADSGIDALYRNHITPDIMVGDFDSANIDALDFYRAVDQVSVIELAEEKDDTDTEHAIRECIRLGCGSITVLGATGTRLDHTISNISLLGLGVMYAVEITLLDQHNRIRMLTKGISIKKEDQFGDYISLIPYGVGVSDITLTGMKYQLEHAHMDSFTSLGISNEITEDTATIEFEAGKMVLLIESRD